MNGRQYSWRGKEARKGGERRVVREAEAMMGRGKKRLSEAVVEKVSGIVVLGDARLRGGDCSGERRG